MGKDNVIAFKNPETTIDLLTEILRKGAQRLLAAAVEEEVDRFLADHNKPEEKPRFVRNGYLPEREIQTGIGAVAVEVPRVRDRAFSKDGVTFGSSIIPKYLRRSRSMEELLPLLYLKGISTNDFADALKPLLGDEAKNLSPGVISRLKAVWEDEYDKWRKSDLSGKRYVYFWADGIHLQARMEDAKECVLVIVSVTEQGNKELITIEDGHRSRTTILTMVFKLSESAQKRWNRLRGFNYLADVIRGIKFVNGKKENEQNKSVHEGAAA